MAPVPTLGYRIGADCYPRRIEISVRSQLSRQEKAASPSRLVAFYRCPSKIFIGVHHGVAVNNCTLAAAPGTFPDIEKPTTPAADSPAPTRSTVAPATLAS